MYLKIGQHYFKMTPMGTILCFTALSGTSAHSKLLIFGKNSLIGLGAYRMRSQVLH
jgi:hypothetical protein